MNRGPARGVGKDGVAATTSQVEGRFLLRKKNRNWETVSEDLKSSSSTFVVRRGNVAPQQRRVDALHTSSLHFRARDGAVEGAI